MVIEDDFAPMIGSMELVSNRTNWSALALTRMLLALVVACGHLGWIVPGNYVSAIAEDFNPKAAVLAFFLISGYSIAASLDRDKEGFYFRRFKRIYPLYLFSVVAAIVLEAALGEYRLPGHVIETRGVITALGNILMLQLTLVKSIDFNGVVWSLALECTYYVAAPFLLRSRPRILAGLVALSLFLFMLPQQPEAGRAYELLLKLNQVKYFWPFGIGLIIYRYRSVGLFIGLAVVSTAITYFSPVSGGTLLSCVTINVTFLAIFSGRLYGKELPLFEYFGDISYPLYLLHLPTFIALYAAFQMANIWMLSLSALAVAAFSYWAIDVKIKQAIFDRIADVRKSMTSPALEVQSD